MPWFPIFLLLAAAGTSAGLILTPAQMGRGFFRFHAAMLLVLATIAVAVGRPLIGSSWTALLPGIMAWVLVADIAIIAGLSFSSKAVSPMAHLLPVVTGAMMAVTVALAAAPGKLGESALLTLHFLTCGALIGSVLVAMNLGHSYLQNAALSFDHLTRLAKFFLGSAIAKTVISVILLVPQAGALWATIDSELDSMLVALRVGVGLLFTIVLGFMVLSCARTKANQSATGILYAALVIVLVGEGLSMHLTLGRGIRV